MVAQRQVGWEDGLAGARGRNKCGARGVCRIDVLLWRQRGGVRPGRASHKEVSRNFNWIWYLGAAVWFLNAALAMRHGNLRMGVTNAVISAVFLAAGIFFGRQGKRTAGRGNGRRPLE